ncbi:SDR family NAD(P)-dependent oxidoreductase [Flagellimonas olearia]|uniref:SDR family NAD(P)-dependent oxidoreductase n=1 Tax=Flagellimonas olearia TaxID=552546 RepID=A0A6I1E376_9FLAO|nr:SDR family oxidoreductase [Allomuricauda olearia]KAB7530380.1 SDR family NAD(P)-dependent oxidoreductase [Allomuricauda olearia]
MSKVIIITGAGGILCGTLATALAKEGHKVAVLDLKETAAARVVDQIKEIGGQAIGIACNVLDRKSLIKAREMVREQFGSCDILINGAGGNHPKGTTTKSHLFMGDLESKEKLVTFFKLDPDGIGFVFNLNFIGTLLPTQIFAEDMVGKKDCSIVNISSMSAYRPLTKIPAYSGAKAAVTNFTQWLAVHFAPVGIRVNALAPGFFLTDQNRKLLTQDDGTLSERGRTILDHTPLNRFGKPEDLVGTTLWLIGNDSKFVTGVVVPIDGGVSAFSGA